MERTIRIRYSVSKTPSYMAIEKKGTIILHSDKAGIANDIVNAMYRNNPCLFSVMVDYLW